MKRLFSFLIFLLLCSPVYSASINNINGTTPTAMSSFNYTAIAGINNIDGNTVTPPSCVVTFPSFTAQTGIATSTLVYSNTITPTYSLGCAVLLPMAVTISGGGSPQFSIGGGAFGTTGNIVTGLETLQLDLTSSGSNYTTLTGTPSIHSQTANWTVQTILAAPTGVAATAGNTQVSTTYTGATGASTYNGYWGTSSVACGSKTKVTGIGASPWVKTGLTNGTHYYFNITDVDSNGNESACSGEVTSVPSYTNYLNDANIFDAWNFENNLNGMANGNTLTINHGSAAYDDTTGIALGTYSAKTTTAWCTKNTFATMPGYIAYTGLTVGGWYREASALSANLMFAYDGTNFSWELALSSGKPYFRITHDGSTWTTNTATNAISNNTLTFIAGTWDGAYLHIWTASGDCTNIAEAHAQVAYSSTTFYSSSMSFYNLAGDLSGNCFYPFTGYSDEHFIFNRSTSQAELISICQHGIDGSK